MRDDVENMAWYLPPGIVHGELSQVGVMPAATLIVAMMMHGWPAASRVSDLGGSLHRRLDDTCFHRGQTGACAVSLPSCRRLLDINGEALLIPTSSTKLITSATGCCACHRTTPAALPCSRSPWFEIGVPSWMSTSRATAIRP
jgi:hypothetical protein